MGYGHSWYIRTNNLPRDQFNSFREDCYKIVASAIENGINIDRDCDSHSPAEFKSNLVRFNGREKSGFGPFEFSRKQNGYYFMRLLRSLLKTKYNIRWHGILRIDCREYFNFCKTAKHPATRSSYDAVVCACLVAAKHYFGNVIRIYSDGENHDWSPARKLLAQSGIEYGQEYKLDDVCGLTYSPSGIGLRTELE
jgi:hypothetical protein